MQMFNSAHHSGPLLYFDLDTVIVNNIDWIHQLPLSYFWGVRDFKYLWRPNYHAINSSIMWWDTTQFDWVWRNFLDLNLEQTMKRLTSKKYTDYKNTSGKGFIYVLKVKTQHNGQEKDCYKIGYTANLEKRMATSGSERRGIFLGDPGSKKSLCCRRGSAANEGRVRSSSQHAGANRERKRRRGFSRLVSKSCISPVRTQATMGTSLSVGQGTCPPSGRGVGCRRCEPLTLAFSYEGDAR
jgi:hypothetical protein